MSIREKKIKIGWEWFYREAGIETEKPPVLLLHGLPAHSYIWRKIMPDLADRGWRAIAPDWLGSGFSSQPEKRDFSYTTEAYVNALHEFINALELERFYLVVQGFLGSIGLVYALQHSDRLAGLIILNTPLSSQAKFPWQMRQWGIPFVGDMLTQDPLLVDRTLEGGSGFVIADEDLAVYRKPFLTSSAVGRALGNTIKQISPSKSMAGFPDAFSEWSLPTLLIWGQQDPWLPITEAENFLAVCPNARLIKLPEAKHYPQEHWSSEVSMAMLKFFRP